MKKFETPEIEVIKFTVEDVITESGEPEMTFVPRPDVPCIS